MQKVTFKNSRGLNLVGDYYPNDSKSIIIICHGHTSSRSRNGVFDTVAKEFQSSGFAVLTFDFSGCGESDDDTLTVEKEVDDLKSAIQFVKEKGHSRIGLTGRSLGGLISFKCFNSDVIAMAHWAPVTNKIRPSWYQNFSKNQLLEFKEKGYCTVVKKAGPRKKVLIDEQMLKEREAVDQEKLLKGIDCPVLILHSPNDEMIPLSDSENAMRYLSPESKLEIIEGANHRFSEHIEIAAQKTKKWFLKYLKI